MKLVFLNFLLLRNENDKWCAEIDFCHWKMKENEYADGRNLKKNTARTTMAMNSNKHVNKTLLKGENELPCRYLYVSLVFQENFMLSRRGEQDNFLLFRRKKCHGFLFCFNEIKRIKRR